MAAWIDAAYRSWTQVPNRAYDVTEAAMRCYVEQTFGAWVPEVQKEIIGKSFDANTHQIILVDGEPRATPREADVRSFR